VAGRSVFINLVGNNRTSSAFLGAAKDADRFRDRLDRLNKTSLSSSTAVQKLTGRTATLAAGLLAVAPAAGAATAAVVAGAGAMAAAFGAAGIAAGAFSLAVKPQFAALENMGKLDDAVTSSTAGTKKHAKAVKAYTEALNKLPPATRDTAIEMSFLKEEFKGWSDALSGDTMPVFTKGIKVLRAVMPKLGNLVATTAHALEDFMDQVLRGVKSKGFDAWLDRVNEAAKKTFPAFLRSAVNVGKGVAGIFDAFLPHAPAMASGIEGLTAKFARWGQSLGESKTFTVFMDNVRANLPALTAIFSNLVQIVGNLAQAFAPMSGISLTLVQHFTAMLAALPPPVLTALATGFIAISGALRILIPLQRALNVVLALNPIGLVVLALAGLALGLVTAYKKSETFRRIVDGAFQGAADTVSRVWKGPFGTALKEIASFLDITLIPKVTDLVGALTGVGDKSAEAGGKLGSLGQSFQGVNRDGAGFERLVRTGIGGALGSLGGPLGAAAGLVAGWFWPKIKGSFQNGIAFVRERWRGWATGMLTTTQNWVVRTGDTVSRGMTGLKNRLFGGLPPLRLSWSSFWRWTKAFADNTWNTLVAGTKKFLRDSRDAFVWGVGAIRSAWSKLKSAAKDPVNFVINTVYNNGIRKLWNKVMGWLHLPGGMELGKVPMLAQGGAVPARPGMFNKPTAIVGEGRSAYPEYVIPTDPRYRSRAQGLWASAGGDLQMLARGGVIGGILDGVKRGAGKVLDLGRSALGLLDNPKKVWDALASRMVPAARHLAGDSWGTAMSRVPDALMERVWGAAEQVIKAFKAGFGGGSTAVVKAAAAMVGRGDDRGENNNWLTRAWGMPGAPWCAMFVSEAIKQAGAGKKYRGYPSAAVASFNAGMRHIPTSMGRPGDLATYGSNSHINIIEAKAGGGYRTIGGNEGPVVKRSTRGGQATVLRPMARGGILDIYRQRNLDPGDRRDPFLRALQYDSGGMLQPGVTLAVNKTGRPEPIFPSTEAAAAYGGGKTINQYFDVTVEDRADVDMVMAQADFRARAASF
jgi:hypothetical protein